MGAPKARRPAVKKDRIRPMGWAAHCPRRWDMSEFQEIWLLGPGCRAWRGRELETSPEIEISNPQAQGGAQPVLDVHPPHAAIHGWRDFFIHIATITIGLLIAIGLEQTVEYVHHLNQLSVARREIGAELNENRRIADFNEKEFARVKGALTKDMDILRASQSANMPVTGLNYGWLFRRTPDGAWQTARQNGALDLMPHSELGEYVYDYAVFSAFMEALTAANVAMEVADAIARRAPQGNLSRKDIEELITATSDSQGKIAFAAKLLQFEKNGLKMPHKAL